MNKLIAFYDIVRKFFYGIWGITIIDFIPNLEFDLLSSINDTLKGFLAIVGAIYFVIQIIFKIIEKNHLRKYNNNIRKIQEMDMDIKKENKEYLEYKKNQHKYNGIELKENE